MQNTMSMRLEISHPKAIVGHEGVVTFPPEENFYDGFTAMVKAGVAAQVVVEAPPNSNLETK